MISYMQSGMFSIPPLIFSRRGGENLVVSVSLEGYVVLNKKQSGNRNSKYYLYHWHIPENATEMWVNSEFLKTRPQEQAVSSTQLGPLQHPHVGASPVHFPTWNCRAKIFDGVILALRIKGKRGGTGLHTPIFLPNSSIV